MTPDYHTAITASATVAAACTACGGSPDGFIRYDTEHSHSEWCPTHNARTRPWFTRTVDAIRQPHTRSGYHDMIARRRADVRELHDDGWSAADIAELLNVSVWVVRDDLKQT